MRRDLPLRLLPFAVAVLGVRVLSGPMSPALGLLVGTATYALCHRLGLL
jgi:hypothetical protein